MSMSDEQSPYDRRAFAYLERGYCVIPIAPGTKRPGAYSDADGWRGMHDWERFFERLPTDLELEHWSKWPGAGIGLLCGKLSGVIALDRDYDAPGTDALEQMIPYTPVKKKGAKGYTAFFRFSGERSCSFNIGGARVLDVLSDGRQTLMPGTLHPDGHTYIYLTEDLLEDFDPADLPALPAGWLEQVAAVLAPYQNDNDKKYASKPRDTTERIDTTLSVSGQYFRELNARALDNLEAWVTKLIPTARRDGEGFRCVATWRDCEKPNVGINPRGIFDFGGNYGMTAIDLIRYANGNLPFQKAADALRAMIPMETTEITMTVGGAVAPPPAPVAHTPQQATAGRAPFPWELPAKVVQAPPSVMLPPETSFTPAPAIPNFLANPPGILGDIAKWITDTAPKSQPELSVAAALAVGSVVMGRTYRSQYGNFTSLYFVMVAKSTEGKEHPQGCCEKILAQSGLDQLIGGSGYTSSGAVYSALLKSPSHLVTIDEMGKLLKLSRSKGNANAEAAIDKLVEAFGRQDGVLRPPTYSTMTLREGQAPKERVIHNPAISLLGATTPATFFDNLTADLVKDGFLGRCIVVESKQPRQLTRFVDRTDPPAGVLDWCKRVHVTGQKAGDIVGALAQTPDMPANTIPLTFDPACKPLMDAFELELNEEKEAAEHDGLDVLLGRTLEKAMKVAMIVAKAKNPNAKTVAPDDLEWSIQYVRHYDTALVRSVKRNKHENEVDEAVKKAVEFVRSARAMAKAPRYAKYAQILQTGAVPHSMLLRHMHMSARAFSDLVATATGAGLLLEGPGTEFGTAAAVFRVGADAE